MNWVSKQINKIAKNLGENFGEAKEEFKESYKDTLKNSDWNQLQTKENEPFIDVFKKGKKIMVIAEICGVNEKDIEVGLYNKENLHISAPTPTKKYSTDIPLPGEVKKRNTSYQYKNGVLSIHLELKKGN